jgi:hypothetical protein
MKMSVKFPYCCSALQVANELDMVVCEAGEISWYTGNRDSNGIPIVMTTVSCPFCDKFEDDKVTLTNETQHAHWRMK